MSWWCLPSAGESGSWAQTSLGQGAWVGGLADTFLKCCSSSGSAMPFSIDSVQADFWILLFFKKKHFSVSCTFCFVAYFYLRQQSRSCGRRDMGTCLLELVDVGCWVGIQIQGMQEELQSWRCPSELEQTKSPGNWAPPLVVSKKAWWMVKNHFS